MSDNETTRAEAATTRRRFVPCWECESAITARCKCHHTRDQHEPERRFSPAFRGTIQPCLVGMCKCLMWVENGRSDD